MIKSDDKFKIIKENKEIEAPFTNFELYSRKVDVLIELVNEQANILKQHGLHTKVEPTSVTEEDIYYSLANSDEEEENEEAPQSVDDEAESSEEEDTEKDVEEKIDEILGDGSEGEEKAKSVVANVVPAVRGKKK